MGLGESITISLSAGGVYLASGSLLVTAAILGVYIYKLNKKVDELTPKYGFAGKKILPIAILAFLAGVTPFTGVLTLRSTEIRRYAREENKVAMSITPVGNEEGKVLVSFSVVPFENGIAWVGESYEVVWNITGPENFQFTELERSNEKVSYFVRTLPVGEYTVKVLVTGEGFNETSEELIYIK